MLTQQKIEMMSPGQYLRCDCYGKPLEIVNRLTNGLGMIYQWTGREFVRVIF